MRAAIILIVLALPVVPVKAQTFGEVEDRQTNVPSYFFHVFPGEATIQVHVWGTVRAPGIYTVGEGATMGDILSLAGGPLLGPIQDNDERIVTVRLMRETDGSRMVAYEAELDTMVREPAAYPVLQGGDVLQVETHQIRGRTFRDTLTVVGAAAGLIAIVLQVINLSTR